MRTAMLPYSKKLCNGDTSMRSPEADKNLKCLFLHYNNHYLRLGPFKYEPVSENPHVGMYREFYTNKEIQVLVDDSKEKLHSTIYYVCIFKFLLKRENPTEKEQENSKHFHYLESS